MTKNDIFFYIRPFPQGAAYYFKKKIAEQRCSENMYLLS